jgi:hypothetical protein
MAQRAIERNGSNAQPRRLAEWRVKRRQAASFAHLEWQPGSSGGGERPLAVIAGASIESLAHGLRTRRTATVREIELQIAYESLLPDSMLNQADSRQEWKRVRGVFCVRD